MGGSFARTLLPDPAASATYDAANRQLTFGDAQMTYDANGNLTSITEPSGTTTFNWDARNRLTALTGPGLTATCAYDSAGRSAQKAVNGLQSEFQYDIANVISEPRGFDRLLSTYIPHYNCVRLHSSLGYRCPVDYEAHNA